MSSKQTQVVDGANLKLSTSVIIMISIFSTLGAILFILISYFLCKKFRIWLKKRAKLNAVKPSKTAFETEGKLNESDRAPTGPSKTRKQSIKAIEGGKKFLSDSQREEEEEEDEEASDLPKKKIKSSLKKIREGGFHEDVLATLPSTTGDADDPFKRENSRAPRRLKENPLNRMFGP